jgi:plasmid maintenance system killer protein
MWHIQEHRDVAKLCRKLPEAVVKKYELWKDIVFRHEKLTGHRAGQRSSRLNLQYRVIYKVERDIVTVFVLEITPHEY